MVGVDACGVEIVEHERLRAERVEAGGEPPAVAVAAEEPGRHRLHQDNDHVLARGLAAGRDAAREGRNARQARAAQVGLRGGEGFGLGHEAELPVLGAQVVERAVEEVEHGVHAEVVEDGAVAEVGRADLDGVVAQAAADAEQASTDEHDTRGERAEPVDSQRTRGTPLLPGRKAPHEPGQEAAEAGRREEVEGDVAPPRGLAENHAEGLRAVFGPVPDGAVEEAAEVAEVGHVGRAAHEHEGVEQAVPPGEGLVEHRAPQARHQGHDGHEEG